MLGHDRYPVLTFHTFIPSHLHTSVFCILPIPSSAEPLLRQLVRPELFAAKVEHLKPESRRLREILASRVLLKQMLGQEVEVLYDADGRPALAAPFDYLHVSISHTEGYAAVILEEQPCGIDIERRGNRVQKVVSHFLTPDEEALLSQQDDPLLALHLAWSAKEAAFKVLGKDYYDLQNLTSVIAIDPQSQVLTLSVVGKETPLFIHYDIHPDYVLTWL